MLSYTGIEIQAHEEVECIRWSALDGVIYKLEILRHLSIIIC